MAKERRNVMAKEKKMSAVSIAKFASKHLNSMVEAMEENEAIAEKFTVMSNEFEILGSSLKEMGPHADPTLAGDMSEESGRIAKALTQLKKRCEKDDPDSLESSLELSSALKAMSGLLVEGANSMRLPCKSDDVKEKLIVEVSNLKDQIGDLAFDMRLVAEGVFESAGDTPSDDPIFFRHPTSGGGCCGSLHGGHGFSNEPSSERLPTTTLNEFDARKLLDEIKKLEKLIRQLMELLIAIASTSLSVSIRCTHDCWPPFTWTAMLVGSGTCAIGNRWQPFFQVQWDYCCQNICWFWHNEVFVVSNVATTNHNVGNTLGLGRRRAALVLGRRHGRRAVDRWNLNGTQLPMPGVRPVLAPPAIPTC